MSVGKIVLLFMINLRNHDGSENTDDMMEVFPCENQFVESKLSCHHFDSKQMGAINGYSVFTTMSDVNSQINSILGSSLGSVNDKIKFKKKIEEQTFSLSAFVRSSEGEIRKLEAQRKRLNAELVKLQRKACEMKNSIKASKATIETQREMLNEKLANVKQECYIMTNKPKQIYSTVLERLHKISDNKSHFKMQYDIIRNEVKGASRKLSLAINSIEELGKQLNKLRKQGALRCRSVTKHRRLLREVSMEGSCTCYLTHRMRNMAGISVSSLGSTYLRQSHSYSWCKSVQKKKSIFD